VNWFKKIIGSVKRIASIRGEWFIDDSGFSQFADGDIGDLNHEAMALQTKVPDELWERFEKMDLTDEEIKEIGEDFCAYMWRGGEAREWMVEKENWIRVHGNNFELNTLDQSALDNIVNFLYKELDESEFENEEICIDELSSGRWYCINARQLIDSIDAGQGLIRLKMRGSSY